MVAPEVIQEVGDRGPEALLIPVQHRVGLGQGLGGPRLQGRGDPGGAGHGLDRFFGCL